jgi:hypothetical protein
MKKKNSQKKSTLRISSKTSKSVENNVRNHAWKFQGREKSGSRDIEAQNGPKSSKMALLDDPLTQNLKCMVFIA